MERKTILGLTAILMSFLAFNEVSAETESSGGGGGGECKASPTNICYNIYQNGRLISTKKGVLHIN
ncbi:hypothetical protein [Sphingobacterium griseoflavum]|nr:hypothetical protein [Sphingobacterium griseoflavum]